MWEKLFWMLMGAMTLLVSGIIGSAIEARRRRMEQARMIEKFEREWRK